MDQKDIMRMITSPGSWEQVIYDVIAWEGLNPWDLDLKALSSGFVNHLQGMETMDFKVPAKFVMVASILLRMKSDHLPLMDMLQEDSQEELEELGAGAEASVDEPVISPLTIPPRRVPERRIVVSELVTALRKVLGTAEKRSVRVKDQKSRILIRGEDLGKRISCLYDRINNILAQNKKVEVGFSSLVGEWKRPAVTETFLPLIYLDHQQRVECRQEEVFDEIYIKNRDKKPIRKKPKRRK